MLLTKREKKIIAILSRQDYMSAAAIAKRLKISEKTVRTDISRINTASEEPVICSHKGKGYRLTVQNIEAGVSAEIESERHILILKDIISGNRTNFYELADRLYIAESTVDKEVSQLNKAIRKRFDNVVIQRKKNELFIDASEDIRRSIFVYFLIREIEEHHYDLENFRIFFEQVDLLALREMVLAIIRAEECVYKDIEIVSFIFHLAVILEQDGLQAELEKEYVKQLLKERLDFGVRETDENYEEFLQEALEDIYDKYNVDLRDDSEFKDKLLIHLTDLFQRAKTNQFINNPLIKDIKESFPLIYDISVFLALKIQSYFHIRLQEDEIGYISLYLVSSMEKRSSVRKRIAVIHPGGSSVSTYILNRLEKFFGDTIDIIGNYSMFRINELKGVDLIVSTIPLTHTQEIPVFQCTNLITKEEIEKINQLLASQEFGRFEEKLGLLHQFDNKLFFPGLDLPDQEAVIRYMCGKLEAAGYCDEQYVEYVLEREEIASTSFANYIAIPHPVKMEAFHSGIAIATLKQDMVWGDNKVRIIFLFALSSESLNLTLFYDALAKSLNDMSKVKAVWNIDEFSRFIEVFFS